MDTLNTPKKHARPLKVYQKNAKRGYKYIALPEIRLHGKWLLMAGFTCGSTISVIHRNNRIVITNGQKIIVNL